LLPVVEDLVEHRPHDAIDERFEQTAADVVPDMVVDLRLLAERCEAMRVLPDAVRPGELHVDERPRRSPVDDLRQPPHWNALDSQPVSDQRPTLELPRRGFDPEMEPRRGDRRKVPRIREEGEDVVDGSRNTLRSLEDRHSHSIVVPAWGRFPPSAAWRRFRDHAPRVIRARTDRGVSFLRIRAKRRLSRIVPSAATRRPRSVCLRRRAPMTSLHHHGLMG